MKLPQTFVIPKGTTFEVQDPGLREQSLVVAHDIPVTIPPGVHVVKLPAYCMNRDLSSPSRAPGRLTPFRMDVGSKWRLTMSITVTNSK